MVNEVESILNEIRERVRKDHEQANARYRKRHRRIIDKGRVDDDRGIGRDNRRTHGGEMQAADRDGQ